MKNLTKLIFVCTFVLFATLFSRDVYLDMGGAGSMNNSAYVYGQTKTYKGIVEDYLLHHYDENKMGKKQYMALDAYARGTMKKSQLRHFERALKKHPCFVSTKKEIEFKGKKLKRLLMIPNGNTVPDWFEIKCPK